MEQLFAFFEHKDLWLFSLVNHRLANPFFDAVMPFLTDLTLMTPVRLGILLLLLWMVFQKEPHRRYAALLLILTITVSDQFSSKVLKFMFERIRPCTALLDVRLLVGCGSGFSFPSSHAVNHFAGAVVLGYFFPRTFIWWLGYAAVIAFSRVYVGVHYPSDVLGGAAIGLLIGWLMTELYSSVRGWNVRKRPADASRPE